MKAVAICALLLVARCQGSFFQDLWDCVKEPLETMRTELLDQAQTTLKSQVASLVGKPELKAVLSRARGSLQEEVEDWESSLLAKLRTGHATVEGAMHDLTQLPAELRALVKQQASAQLAGQAEAFLKSKADKLLVQAKKELIGRLNGVVSSIVKDIKGVVRRQAINPFLPPVTFPTASATDAATVAPSASDLPPVTSGPVTPDEIAAVFKSLTESYYFRHLSTEDQILVLELASSGLAGKMKEVLDLAGYERIFTFLNKIPLKYVETMITYVLDSLKRGAALSS